MNKRYAMPRWFARAHELAKAEWARHLNWEKNAVYLTDPAAQQKIDRHLKKEILPMAVASMSSSKFRIRNQQTLGTEEEWYIQATRTLRLQIEDQLRPIVPGIYPPWHADLEIQCHVRGVHFLRNYLVVSAPRTTELKLLVDVLAETSHHGIPSQL